MRKIRVYHFHNGTGGGILSVIKNLVKFSINSKIENHIIHAVNKAIVPDFTIKPIEGAISQKLFFYSGNNNFYYTCRKLAKLLPDSKAIIIAHDWLELGMVSNLGLQNPVVFFLHGDYDYYYQLAQMHEPSIDQYICVAKNIENKLLTLLPSSKDNIVYQRFPVPVVINKNAPKNNCSVIFIGRLTEGKGYPILPVIAKALREKNIDIAWHIVGSTVITKDDVVWDTNINVHFYDNISNDEVLALLTQMKILILPSIAEGMPLVIIEAMKAGVIPIVNDIDGGIQELVIENETGYKIKNNNVNDYVERITELINNKDVALTLQNNCITLANEMFNPKQNTLILEDNLVMIYTSKRKSRYPFKAYGSRLDTQWIPNWVVFLIRKFQNSFYFSLIDKSNTS